MIIIGAPVGARPAGEFVIHGYGTTNNATLIIGELARWAGSYSVSIYNSVSFSNISRRHAPSP